MKKILISIFMLTTIWGCNTHRITSNNTFFVRGNSIYNSDTTVIFINSDWGFSDSCLSVTAKEMWERGTWTKTGTPPKVTLLPKEEFNLKSQSATRITKME